MNFHNLLMIFTWSESGNGENPTTSPKIINPGKNSRFEGGGGIGGGFKGRQDLMAIVKHYD